jgi:hypothetical protein
MYLNALGQPIMVVNSLKAATELLDRRATVYSDRPRMMLLMKFSREASSVSYDTVICA